MHMRGFTFIETIIALAVFTLAMGAVGGFLMLGYRTQGYAYEQAQAIGETRRGAENMAKEIREATIGADGTYALLTANDYELVFHTGLDKDNEIELVRYAMSPAGGPTTTQTQYCTTTQRGGNCSVAFSGFATTELQEATVAVSVEGDLDATNETATVTLDGFSAGILCSLSNECGQCAGAYQDLTSFPAFSQAQDNSLQVVVAGSNQVDSSCNWQTPGHSLKAKVDLIFKQGPLPNSTAILQKTITNPAGWPPQYIGSSETYAVSENVRNEARGLPLFTYYDKNNQIITDLNQRLQNTTRIHVNFIVNVNPLRPPGDFAVETDAVIREATYGN